MTAKLPDWLPQVPVKTVGVLCAVTMFGKNIESRQIVLAGKRYFHNAVENVVNYALNPILPDLSHLSGDYNAAMADPEDSAIIALKNVTDCFNYIFHIQIEYFKLLKQLLPERFRFKNGKELHLNQFAGKSPTLINSEKRYLILSRIDGAQPYDLDIDWSAEFNCLDDQLEDLFRDRLFQAQEAYAGTLHLSDWYNNRDRNLIIPLKVILDDLSYYFSHLGRSAYHMAKNSRRDSQEDQEQIKDNLHQAVMHLERFTLDLARMNIFTIVKHDRDKLTDQNLSAVVKARAADDSRFGENPFESQQQIYGSILMDLFQTIGYAPATSFATA
jgi:hypothetical protein